MKIPRLVIVGGKLALICTVAAVVLALVNAVTAPVIIENRARALAEGLAAVAAHSGVAGVQVGEAQPIANSEVVTTAYPMNGSDGVEIGFIFQLVGTGYGGDMQLLAGYLNTGELFSARMMENQETPGLGKKAESPAYMMMYTGHGAATRVPTSKNDLPAEHVDSITGATITFLGVGRALAEGSAMAKTLGGTPAGGMQ